MEAKILSGIHKYSVVPIAHSLSALPLLSHLVVPDCQRPESDSMMSKVVDANLKVLVGGGEFSHAAGC